MPDAFFANSKKRKRSSSSIVPSSGKSAKRLKQPLPSTSRTQKRRKDEELSSGGSEGSVIDDEDLRADEVDPGLSGEEDANETAAEKRLRLAKLYLDSVKTTLAEGEFDAADLDREIISSRLQQDVLQHSGKVHLFIAEKISYAGSSNSRLITRGHRLSVTGAAASENGHHLFTCSKDGSVIHWDLRTGKQKTTFAKVAPKGKGKQRARQEDIDGHSDELWALSLSSDGKYLATGGKDRRVGVWDVEKGAWLKGFRGHKDSISGLAFRKGSSQLYSASHDRSVRLFDISVLGFVEQLFGHQDRIADIDALRGETALTAGSRDKTVRFWKVADETQIVFRGGTKSVLREVLEGALDADGDDLMEEDTKRRKGKQNFVEGSMECVAMVDETTFLSGGDSGTISLWSTAKKKPIFKYQLAHGLAEHHSETEGRVSNPRWVTAIATLPYSDLFVSGSWDGYIRLWRLDRGLKSFEPMDMMIPINGIINSLQLVQTPSGPITDAAWMKVAAEEEHDGEPDAQTRQTNGIDSGKGLRMVLVVAAIGQEPRTGRWLRVAASEGAKNCGLVVPLRVGS